MAVGAVDRTGQCGSYSIPDGIFRITKGDLLETAYTNEEADPEIWKHIPSEAEYTQA